MADETKRSRFVRYQFGAMFGIYDRRTDELVASGRHPSDEREQLLQLLQVEQIPGNSIDWMAGTDKIENVIEDLNEIELMAKARERAAVKRRAVEEKFAAAKAELEALQNEDPLEQERAEILKRREERRQANAEAEAKERRLEREAREAKEAEEAEKAGPVV